MLEAGKISYEAAVADHALRQQFLDQLDLGALREHVLGVTYVECNGLSAALEARHFSITILVGPALFKSDFVEADVVSALRDHEGEHLRRFFNEGHIDKACDYWGPRIHQIIQKEREALEEIACYRRQSVNARECNMDLSHAALRLNKSNREANVAKVRTMRRIRKDFQRKLNKWMSWLQRIHVIKKSMT